MYLYGLWGFWVYLEGPVRILSSCLTHMFYCCLELNFQTLCQMLCFVRLLILDCSGASGICGFFTWGRMDDGGTKLFHVKVIFHAVWDIDFFGVKFACLVFQ